MEVEEPVLCVASIVTREGVQEVLLSFEDYCPAAVYRASMEEVMKGLRNHIVVIHELSRRELEAVKRMVVDEPFPGEGAALVEEGGRALLVWRIPIATEGAADEGLRYW